MTNEEWEREIDAIFALGSKPKHGGPLPTGLLDYIRKHQMPRIPAPTTDSLKTEYSVLREDLTYKIMIKKIKLDPQGDWMKDKNENPYFGLEAEVISPEEFRGKQIFDNYILVPNLVWNGTEWESIDPETLPLSEKRKAEDAGVKYARFMKCFDVDLADGFDTDDVAGQEGEVKIQNEEYQGKPVSRIKDYLL